MGKPDQASGYNKEVTENCERILVTLLRGLGPWKDSIYLVGGLTPRYLIKDKPPRIPPHAGSLDIDIVVELQVLTDTQAYYSLEENFQKLGFENAKKPNGEKISWRWQTKIENGATIIFELLTDDPKLGGGKVQPLPIKGDISALNIPHSSMVFDHHEVKEIRAELLGNEGIAIETVRYADIVSFTCLKSYALDDRHERKDAYDIVYCLEHCEGGWKAAAKAFRTALEGEYKEIIESVLSILEKRFTDDKATEGYKKDGPVAVAKFELSEKVEMEDARILRQREVANLITHLLQEIKA